MVGLEVVEALTTCTKQPQKQDVRFRQTTAAMLEVLTYTPSIAEVHQLLWLAYLTKTWVYTDQ